MQVLLYSLSPSLQWGSCSCPFTHGPTGLTWRAPTSTSYPHTHPHPHTLWYPVFPTPSQENPEGITGHGCTCAQMYYAIFNFIVHTHRLMYILDITGTHSHMFIQHCFILNSSDPPLWIPITSCMWFHLICPTPSVSHIFSRGGRGWMN